MQWWLLNDPEFKARYCRVYKPIRDVGIDICAVPHDGAKPTAVQCKQWKGEIPKSEIDSFLSAAATDEYGDSLLIHTGSGFSANAALTIAAQRAPCAVVDLDRLLRSDVVWPAGIDELETGATMSALEPGEHQREALARVRAEFGRPGRGRTWVNMACGSGKTLVATLAADEFAPRLAVVFVQTTTALHEAVRAWTRDARVRFAALRVCSRHDVDAVEDPVEPHKNRTTSAVDIVRFLRGGGRRVVFCTYRSASRLADAAVTAHVTFDLVIADDAHHIACHRRSAVTTAVLDDDRLAACRRLFLTATPRTWESGALRAATRHGSRLVDMRDAVNGDFGARAYYLPYREAQERGIVLPFHVHVVEITTREVERVVASRRAVAADGHSRAVSAQLAATQIAVVKAADDLGLRRIVAFHRGVDESAIFADSFAATATLVESRDSAVAPIARHVDVYDARRRREALRWFGHDPRPCLLSNVKLLAEGHDRPEIDAIIWNDPEAPPARVVQAVGRALRRAPGKRRAIVIVPMIVGPDRNIDRALMTTAFASTIHILDALRTIDPDFKLTRESLRFYAATRSHGTRSRSSVGGSAATWDAPLELTDAFADAIEHLLLPPPQPRTVAPPRASRLRNRQLAVRSPAPARPKPRPGDSRAVERGLDRLEAMSGDRLLFGLDAPADRNWLTLVRERFQEDAISSSDLERIAGHLSFLAGGLGPCGSDLRFQLGRYSERPVQRHLAAWLADPHAPAYLAPLVTTARRHHWPLESLLDRLHEALAHPGMSAIDRAKITLRPLLAATSGLGEREDPSARLAGLLAAIERPSDPAPPSSPNGWHPESPTDAGRAEWTTYEAGWNAGQPWRAQARLIGALPIAAFAREIAWAVARDFARSPRARWDFTMWAIYIDELGRTEGRRRDAQRAARTTPYRERAARVASILARRSAVDVNAHQGGARPVGLAPAA